MNEALLALQSHVPRASPGIGIDIPAHFCLRSLTINPVFIDLGLGATRVARAIDTAIFRKYAALAKDDSPMIWVEIHLSTDSATAIELPDLSILVSPSFGYGMTLRRDWLRYELSRSLAIVSEVAIRQPSSSLEVAYGIGASAMVGTTNIPQQKQEYASIRRPWYSAGMPEEEAICYFCAPACIDVMLVRDSPRIVLRALPIDLKLNCPVGRRIAIKQGESIALWVPFKYPAEFAFLTEDERRLLSFTVLWRQAQEHHRVEVLSFPRVSSRYRLVRGNPSFHISPALPNDPAVWRSYGTSTFALQADRIAPTDLTGYSKVGIVLELEDGFDKEQLEVQKLWSTNLVAVIVGVMSSVAVESYGSHQASQEGDRWSTGLLLSVGVVLIMIAWLWLLVSRRPRARRHIDRLSTKGLK